MYVGIDVSKACVDVAVRPTGQMWTISNDESGIREPVSRLKALDPAMVVLESTGGLELPSVAALAAAALPVAIVNPRQVRDFARATGTLAKTDALDAVALAHFADAVRPVVRPLKDAETQVLSSLVARRHCAAVRSGGRDDILRSVPRVGEQLSLALLSQLPESGTLNRRQVAAPVGVAPSTATATRCEVRGRSGVVGRGSAQFCTWEQWLPAASIPSSGTSTSDSWRPASRRRVALTACRRKLLVILNSMLKSRSPWHAEHARTPALVGCNS